MKTNSNLDEPQTSSSLQILSKYQPQQLLVELEKHTENVIDKNLFKTLSGKPVLEYLQKMLTKNSQKPRQNSRES